MYEIMRKEKLAPNIALLEVKAPSISQKARPGQFIILRLDEIGERIPLTIADSNSDTGTVTIIFQEVGLSTKLLGMCEVGDFILDFVGPLGRPSHIDYFGNVICVGGGVGVAPLYPITRALFNQGNNVCSIIGARSGDMLILEQEIARVSHQLLVATDDGSYGFKGFVTDLLKTKLGLRSVDLVVAIGPLPMMEAVAETTRSFNIKTIVSMNPIMVDGTGMCGACRISVGGKTRFACVEGPEFDAHQVDWEVAKSRARMFLEEEKTSLQWAEQKEQCKCGGHSAK